MLHIKIELEQVNVTSVFPQIMILKTRQLNRIRIRRDEPGNNSIPFSCFNFFFFFSFFWEYNRNLNVSRVHDPSSSSTEMPHGHQQPSFDTYKVHKGAKRHLKICPSNYRNLKALQSKNPQMGNTVFRRSDTLTDKRTNTDKQIVTVIHRHTSTRS